MFFFGGGEGVGLVWIAKLDIWSENLVLKSLTKWSNLILPYPNTSGHWPLWYNGGTSTGGAAEPVALLLDDFTPLCSAALSVI